MARHTIVRSSSSGWNHLPTAGAKLEPDEVEALEQFIHIERSLVTGNTFRGGRTSSLFV